MKFCLNLAHVHCGTMRYWAIPFNIGPPLLRGLDIQRGRGGGVVLLNFPRG